MHPAEFEYLSPSSLEQVIALLERHGDEAKVLAGGQSLVPMMTLRLLQPGFLIDINGLPTPEIHTDNGMLVLPAGTRHRALTQHALVAQHAPMIRDAAAHIGNVRVRARGTVGGSVAHADPAAELPCVLTALDAEVVAEGRGGRRTIPAREFFLTYLTTALEPTELVTEVRVPRRNSGTGHAFLEFTRRASDFAVVEVAAVLRLDGQGSCASVSLVLGGVEDRPRQLGAEAAAVLVGERPTTAAFEEAGRRAEATVTPHDDVHGSAAYRRRLVRVLTSRALEQAWSDANRETA